MDTELKRHIEDVEFDGLLLKDLPLAYRANKQVVKAAIVKKFNEYYWDDKMFTSKMFEVLQAFEYADESVRNDKDFVLELIKKCSGYLFKYLPEILRNDDEVFLKAITHTGLAYVYSELEKCENKNFSIDDTIHLSGLKYYLMNTTITEFAGPKILSNKQIMLVALEYDPLALEILDNELKDDDDIVTKAVCKFGYTLGFSSERLRDHKNVVLNAIYATCQENFMEDFTGEEYWGEMTHLEWEFISDRLKLDKSIYLEIINNTKKYYKGEFVLNLAPEEIKDNEEVVMAAINKNKIVIKFASKRLQEKLINFYSQ